MNQPYNSLSIDYRQSIFTLTTALKQLQDFSQRLNLPDLVELISDALNHIESNSFSIGVFGNFNGGKSTFINALLGRDILPSDILATTATLSRIIHRLIPGGKIRFKDGSEQEIALEELADYVTKLTSESEATAATLQEAVVYYPLPFCQNNIEIIDTPGLNDDGKMTAITSKIISKCDLAIMVISCLSPFSITEGKFLTTQLLANGIHRVLFVVNQIDLFNQKDAEKVINLIVNRIVKCVVEWVEEQPNSQEYFKKIGKIKVYGISAFQALQAKQTNNIPLLAQSRFVNFEYTLKTLINQERGLIQLQLTVNRIITCIIHIIKHVESQKYELEQEQANLSKMSQAINEKITNIRHIKTETFTSIDTIINNAKQQAQTSYHQLENKMKAAAKQVIESTDINASQQSNLATKVLDAVQSTTKDVANKICMETQQAVNIVLVQNKNFAESCYKFIPQLQLEMNQLGLDTTICSKVIDIVRSVNQVCDGFNQKQPSLYLSFPSNSEIFVFADESNGSGTTIGAVIGFILTAGNPIGGAVGSAIGAAVGSNIKANKFKESYQTLVMAEIEKQLRLMNVNQTVDEYISKAFSRLEELQTLFIQGVNSLLDSIQNNLAELYGNREATIVVQQRELNQIQVETQRIMCSTQKFSEQLSQLGA